MSESVNNIQGYKNTADWQKKNCQIKNHPCLYY